MIIVDELKEGFNIMLHPKSATQKERKIGEALAFYYKLSIIPLILDIILALAVPSASATGLFTGFLSGLLVIGGILALLVVIPISLFVTAFLYHIFGKLFKVFSNPYSNTFTATVYGIVPTILFYWLSPIPLGSFVLIIFEIWAFIVTILAIANQQKTSALKAFAVIITPIVIILLIVAGALFSLGLFSSSLMSSSASSSNSSNIFSTSCISGVPFSCSTPILRSGTLSVVLGQYTGTSINNVTLCFVPGTATPSSCSGYPSYYVGNWPNGQTINAAFSVSGIPTTYGELSGRIFASYGGSIIEAAAVIAKAT